MLTCTVPGAIAASSGPTHGGFHKLLSQSAACFFLCLKSGYFALACKCKSKPSWSTLDSSQDPVQTHTYAIKTDTKDHAYWCLESTKEHESGCFSYLLQPVIPPLWRVWEKLLPKFLYDPPFVACHKLQKLVKRIHMHRALPFCVSQLCHTAIACMHSYPNFHWKIPSKLQAQACAGNG